MSPTVGRKALRVALGIIEWMSGSTDFGPGGCAAKGWKKLQPDLKYLRHLSRDPKRAKR